ncbi:MAG: hypothetical protein LBE21_09895 [Pseudomonadales bacterium]|jgi:hypothetical protein|nr:hypothetical protein [Pseudomonadales bacterium]
MKHIIIASLLLSTISATSLAKADQHFVNGDGSPLSGVCLAALDSRDAAISAAAELGMSRRELYEELYCNGMPLERFVRAYRAHEQVVPVQQKVEPIYVLKSGDASALTEVCLASVKSREAFNAATAKLDAAITLDEIRCNGLKLTDFARRYGRSNLTASIQ